MSHIKDTDYLGISTRIHAMENRMLTRERMDRMIEARDDAEALKVLSECGYAGGETIEVQNLEQVLSAERAFAFREIRAAVPDTRIADVFQIKYDYHNAKVLIKAQAMGKDGERLLLSGGRYDPKELLEGWRKEELRGLSDTFRAALKQAQETLAATKDPQLSDLVLDRACYEEMAQLAKDTGSKFLQGYVSLSVDVANLRTAVRVHRMDKGSDFLSQVLLPGGSVSPRAIAVQRGEDLAGLFQAGPLAAAAELGSKLAQPGAGALTAFERECDNALTAYLETARRVPFGEQAVIGYLYAKEAELTAVRTILAGRRAGLSGERIRERLRETYV